MKVGKERVYLNGRVTLNTKKKSKPKTVQVEGCKKGYNRKRLERKRFELNIKITWLLMRYIKGLHSDADSLLMLSERF